MSRKYSQGAFYCILPNLLCAASTHPPQPEHSEFVIFWHLSATGLSFISTDYVRTVLIIVAKTLRVRCFPAPSTGRHPATARDRPRRQPCSSTRPCRCSPSSVSPSGLGDTALSRRLAHDIRRLSTRPDSPVVLRVARAAHPKSRDVTSASTPGRLANAIPRPLLDRFHPSQVETLR